MSCPGGDHAINGCVLKKHGHGQLLQYRQPCHFLLLLILHPLSI